MSADDTAGAGQVSRELPKYRCHKTVWALKIKAIDWDSSMEFAMITPAEEGYAPFSASAEYMDKHDPEVGGYYVVYPGDGYKSYSPAQPFKDGYTRI